MEKRATLKDISDILGVSVTTVYKALNNKPKVGESLRKEILELAQELNYKPNKIAQALSRNPLKIGAIIPETPKTFYDYVRSGLEKAFAELEDYNVVGEVISVKNIDEAEKAWDRLYSIGVNGIVAAFSEFNPGCRAVQDKYDIDIPILCIVSKPLDRSEILGGLFVPHNYMGALAAEIICMSVSDKSRPMIVCIPEVITNVHEEGKENFYKGCIAHGCDNIHTYLLNYNVEDQKKVAEKILTDHPDVAGIYVGSNNSYVLCKYFESRNMAGKVRIVGHDLYPELAECLKAGSLTAAIFQNQHDNARKAVKELVNYLSGEYGSFQDIQFRPEVVYQSNLEMYNGLY